MRDMPREWNAKTVAMRESKDLNNFKLHDLFSDLKAYKFELGISIEEETSTSHPTKALAIAIDEPLVHEESPCKKYTKKIINEAMSLFVKKIGMFMWKNEFKFVKSYHKKDQTYDGQACFNSGMKGHFIVDYNCYKIYEKNSFRRRRSRDDKKSFKKKMWLRCIDIRHCLTI